MRIHGSVCSRFPPTPTQPLEPLTALVTGVFSPLTVVDNIGSCSFCLPFLETMATAVTEKEKETSTKLQAEIEMKETLEKQMMAHREQHQKQLSSLREEISEKQALIDGLKE